MVAATSWRLSSSISSSARAVFGFAGLAVGQHLRRADDAVLALEVGKALLVAIDAGLQVSQLRGEPAGGLCGGLNLRFGFLLAVSANERIDYGRPRGRRRASGNESRRAECAAWFAR